MTILSRDAERKLHEAYSEMDRKYTEILAEELCGKRVVEHDGTAILDKDGPCTIYAVYGFSIQSGDVYGLTVGVTDLRGDWENENVRLLPTKIEING